MMARSTKGSNQRSNTLMQDRTSANSMKVLLQRQAMRRDHLGSSALASTILELGNDRGTDGRRQRCKHPPRRCSLARENDVLEQRIDLVSPAVTAEYAVMPDPRLHMVPLEIGAQSGTQVVRGHRLSDGTDVVALAFDGEQHGALDGARLDAFALPFELAGRQRTFLKNDANGFQIEFRRQVEHGEVLVVKRLGDLRLLVLALHQMIV